MNDQELVELLLGNYTRQHALYKALLGNLNAGLPAAGAAPDVPRILKALSERNRAFDEIKRLDERIQANKIGWDRRKNELSFVRAETLKAVLRNIKDVLSQVMDANRRLEEVVARLAGKAKA
jgi:hypothetical protein